MESAVQVEGLVVETADGGRQVLPPIDFTVKAGEIVGIAGETGSGKTTLGLAMLGFQRTGLVLTAGRVVIHGQDLARAGTEALRSLRGDRIAYVPQDPGTALNPALRVREAFGQVVSAHGMLRDPARDAHATELFESVGLPSTPEFFDRFPHQLSGGQQQRLAIAVAFALHPSLVIMDEPTTGLDASTKIAVMTLVRQLSDEHGSSVVLISHDLRMLMGFTDRIVVLRSGRIVEDLPSSTIAEVTSDDYTRRLLDALPDPLAHRSVTRAPVADASLLLVESLSVWHGTSQITKTIDLALDRGQCLAIVGESESGKTTIARGIAGFHSHYDGRVQWAGRTLAPGIGMRSRLELGSIQYVFQNPYSSLNPRKTIRQILAAPARITLGHTRREAVREAAAMLETVGLESRLLDSMPGALSGGQRQRVAIARALMTHPELLICDEITSSLDVSVQADIVALLQKLQRERGLSMLFITHDLALVSSVASRVMVLRAGEVIERGMTEQVLERPKSDYTRQLLAVG